MGFIGRSEASLTGQNLPRIGAGAEGRVKVTWQNEGIWSVTVPFYEKDPAFAEMEALARRLEAAVAATNEALLKLAGIDSENIVAAFAETQGQLLGFDDLAMQKFRQALEDKRVTTLAMGNVFMTCVLSSAVALSEFKRLPQRSTGHSLLRRLDRLRTHSTNGLALAAFAWSSFYAVLGKGTWRKVKARRRQRSLSIAQDHTKVE
jgi:hypothetical protein